MYEDLNWYPDPSCPYGSQTNTITLTHSDSHADVTYTDIK